jgi:hypothetical protein
MSQCPFVLDIIFFTPFKLNFEVAYKHIVSYICVSMYIYIYIYIYDPYFCFFIELEKNLYCLLKYWLLF